ncbi:MAG: FtsX-like permease family protein [Acidobacteriota bacterium]
MRLSTPSLFLFRSFILRRLFQEKPRSLVTVLGISLGIGVILAIQLANESSVRGFKAALEVISGRTSLEITGAAGPLDELRVMELSWLEGFGQVSPIVEGEAVFRTASGAAEVLRVLGVDILRDRSFREYKLVEFANRRTEPSAPEFLGILNDPRAVVLTRRFAEKHGIEVGQVVEVIVSDRRERLTVKGLLRHEGPARALDGNVALMDIAAAQWMFGRLGRLDRIDVLLDEERSVVAAEQEIAKQLPAGLRVQRPTRRGEQVERMLQAFHFNLAALSNIALLVGLFLVYNTVSTSVITRRKEIGVLRSLGVSRPMVMGLFLGEAAGLAAVGCLVALPLARLLSLGAIRLTSTTVKHLYVSSAAAPATIGMGEVCLAFGVGLPLALFAAGIPAREASRIAPAEAIRSLPSENGAFRLGWQHRWLPPILFGLAFWFSRFEAIDGLPVFGYAAALSIVFGAAFIVPWLLAGFSRFGAKPLNWMFGVEGRLANSNLVGGIKRISVSVAALAVSLSMLTAIAIMIGSFRETVIYWVGQTLRADLYVAPATRSNVASDSSLSPDVEQKVRAHPDVIAVDRFVSFLVPYDGGTILLGGGEFRVLLDHGGLLFKSPKNGREAMQSAAERDAVLVSESFSLKYRKKTGDSLVLDTSHGAAAFQVAAVYYDYASDRGTVVMDRSCLERHFGPQPLKSLTVYLKPGANAEEARDSILSSVGSAHRVSVHTNSSLRAEVLRIFDSTFAITYALEAIAIFVAILGIAATLFTLILDRKADLRVLRWVGAEQGQIRRMVVIEAALLGLASQLIGLGVGWLLSLVLIYVINVQSFGWTIQFHLPSAFLLQSSVLILVATALAGLYPAHRASALEKAVAPQE